MGVRISVGMPIYNGEPWLGPAIESILSQTLGDLELIISDNVSTDNTEIICRGYAKQDRRVRYYRNGENIGGPLNHNVAFTRSVGTYFKWASCNDICDIRFLSECVAILDAHPDAVLCYPKSKLIQGGTVTEYDETLQLIDDDAYSRYIKLLASIKLNDFMQGVIRADALRKTRLIGNYFSSDSNLMAELSLYGKIYQFPEYLYYRRMGAGVATVDDDHDQLIRHYHPNSDNRMFFQNWRIQFGRFPGVWRAPQSVACKVRVSGHLVKQIWWARRALVADAALAVKASAASLPRHRLPS